MVISAILSVLGLGFMVYVLFTLAIYALPVFVAITVALHVHDTDAGLFGAIAAGFVSGAGTLLAGQIAFATLRSVPIRLAIGALYAGPAGIASYHAITGLCEFGGASAIWTLVFGWIGAVLVGGTAWARIASLSEPDGGVGAVGRGFSAGRAANDS